MASKLCLNLNELNSESYIDETALTTNAKDVTMENKMPVRGTNTKQTNFANSDIELDDTNTWESIIKTAAEKAKEKSHSKKNGDVTFEDIAHLLPKSAESPQNVQRLHVCRYPMCKRVGSKQAYDYCPDHLVRMVNEGKITLPRQTVIESHQERQQSPRMRGKREKHLRQSSDHTRLPNANTVVIPHVQNLTIDVNGRTTIDGETMANFTRPRSSNATRSSRTQKSYYDNDISESGGSSDEEGQVRTISCLNRKATKSAPKSKKNHGHRRRKCVNTVCEKEGLDIYNKLCVTCYNKLADANAQKIALPLPDEVLQVKDKAMKIMHPSHLHPDMPRTIHKDLTRKTVHKIKNCHKCRDSGYTKHCLNCGSRLEGGCYCSRCDQSTCICSDRTETGVTTIHYDNQRRSNQAPAGLRKNRYLANGGGLVREDISTDGPLDSCEYDDRSMSSYSQESVDPTVSLVSVQPSESGEEYPSMLSILGRDFRQGYTHFPSDRG